MVDDMGNMAITWYSIMLRGHFLSDQTNERHTVSTFVSKATRDAVHVSFVYDWFALGFLSHFGNRSEQICCLFQAKRHVAGT